MRRPQLAFVALLVGCFLAEALSLIGLAVLFDGYQSAGRHLAEASGQESHGQPHRVRPPRVVDDVVHPFLGYVTDPSLNVRERRRESGRLEVDEHGFFRRGPKPPADPDAFRVGIFGGSVAFVLSFDAHGELVSNLEGVPQGKTRRVVVDSFALGGYKQPQQLMALAWLLSLGERFDLVVNLDGFNEVALSVNDNVPRGIYPLYPAKWSQRIGTYDDPEVLRRIGELRFARDRRVALGRSFDRPPIRFSPTLLLVWSALDRRKSREIHELEARAQGAIRADRPFQRFGPPFDATNEEATLREIAAFWGRASKAMAALATAHGARYYHFLQPNQYLPGSKPLSAREREIAFEADSPYLRLVTAGYPLLREQGARLVADGISFYDLSMIFENDTRDLYVDVCCHIGTDGNRELARAITSAIQADQMERQAR